MELEKKILNRLEKPLHYNQLANYLFMGNTKKALDVLKAMERRGLVERTEFVGFYISVKNN
jgi:DNA-binding HxlR family transcriptional regulator